MRNSRRYSIIYLLRRLIADTSISEIKDKKGQGNGYWSPPNSTNGCEENPGLPYFGRMALVRSSSKYTHGKRTDMILQLELGKHI
jgi:hypothetical protein